MGQIKNNVTDNKIEKYDMPRDKSNKNTWNSYTVTLYRTSLGEIKDDQNKCSLVNQCSILLWCKLFEI